MSSFPGLIYAVIPVADLTIERQNMIRASVNTEIDSLSKTTDGQNVMVLFISECSGPFVDYFWLTENEARTEMEKPEWPIGEAV